MSMLSGLSIISSYQNNNIWKRLTRSWVWIIIIMETYLTRKGMMHVLKVFLRIRFVSIIIISYTQERVSMWDLPLAQLCYDLWDMLGSVFSFLMILLFVHFYSDNSVYDIIMKTNMFQLMTPKSAKFKSCSNQAKT